MFLYNYSLNSTVITVYSTVTDMYMIVNCFLNSTVITVQCMFAYNYSHNSTTLYCYYCNCTRKLSKQIVTVILIRLYYCTVQYCTCKCKHNVTVHVQVVVWNEPVKLDIV